jgi:hypothetical protein
MQSVGLLGSTGMTPLPRYSWPRRLPACSAMLMSSHAPRVPPTCRSSQVPRSVFRHAPSPITPAGPVAAYARSSPPATGFTHLRKVSRLGNSVTRPNRIHLRYGSRLRFGRLRRTSDPKVGTISDPDRHFLRSSVTPSATCRTSNSPGKLLSVYQTDQAWPGAPEDTEKEVLVKTLTRVVGTFGRLGCHDRLGRMNASAPRRQRYGGFT